MNIRQFFFICLFLPLNLFAFIPSDGDLGLPQLKDPKDIINLQLKSLNATIERSQKTTTELTEIREQIKHYQQIQELYLENVEDRKLLKKMFLSADAIYQRIKKENLYALFDYEFLSELKLLSQLNNRMSLPKPKLTEP